jgi:hypothetical protein
MKKAIIQAIKKPLFGLAFLAIAGFSIFYHHATRAQVEINNESKLTTRRFVNVNQDFVARIVGIFLHFGEQDLLKLRLSRALLIGGQFFDLLINFKKFRVARHRVRVGFPLRGKFADESRALIFVKAGVEREFKKLDNTVCRRRIQSRILILTENRQRKS